MVSAGASARVREQGVLCCSRKRCPMPGTDLGCREGGPTLGAYQGVVLPASAKAPAWCQETQHRREQDEAHSWGCGEVPLVNSPPCPLQHRSWVWASARPPRGAPTVPRSAPGGAGPAGSRTGSRQHWVGHSFLLRCRAHVLWALLACCPHLPQHHPYRLGHGAGGSPAGSTIQRAGSQLSQAGVVAVGPHTNQPRAVTPARGEPVLPQKSCRKQEPVNM